MDITAVREALSTIDIDGQVFDFSNEEVKYFGSNSAISVRVPHIESSPSNFGQKIADHLYNSFADKVPEDKTLFLLNKGSVGPKIGAELSGKALMAIISALGLILLYISIRFEFRFAGRPLQRPSWAERRGQKQPVAPDCRPRRIRGGWQDRYSCK